MTASFYTRIHAWDNLLLAYRKASKGKRSQPNVATWIAYRPRLGGGR